MRAELAGILEHAGKIQALELEGVEPTSHALPLRNAMREDVVKPSLPQEKTLAIAPEVEDDRFRVPRIVEDA